MKDGEGYNLKDPKERILLAILLVICLIATLLLRSAIIEYRDSKIEYTKTIK